MPTTSQKTLTDMYDHVLAILQTRLAKTPMDAEHVDGIVGELSDLAMLYVDPAERRRVMQRLLEALGIPWYVVAWKSTPGVVLLGGMVGGARLEAIDYVEVHSADEQRDQIRAMAAKHPSLTVCGEFTEPRLAEPDRPEPGNRQVVGYFAPTVIR
jgi:hypothetical protein